AHASPETLSGHGHTIHMDGRAVRDFIAEAFPRLVAEAAGEAGVKPADLALVVPHQPNPRLVASLAGDAGLGPEQLVITGRDVGHIGAASLPFALDRAVREGRIGAGDLVLLVGFGAGVTWGRALITWPARAPAGPRRGAAGPGLRAGMRGQRRRAPRRARSTCADSARRSQAITASTAAKAAGSSAHASSSTRIWVRTAPAMRPISAVAA